MYMRNLQACGEGICISGLPAAIEIMQSRAVWHRRIRGAHAAERRAENCGKVLKGKTRGRRKQKMRGGESERQPEKAKEERRSEERKIMAGGKV